MFGIVSASPKEMTPAQRQRYNAVYCGICREIRKTASQTARLCLSYDMVFLAMLLESLYEPAQISGDRACMLHPFRPKKWICDDYIAYAADMNVALAYYKCLDDWQDEGKASARILAKQLEKFMSTIREKWPRQCRAMETCIAEISRMEKEGCSNPDEPAGSFGRLMEELLVYRSDHWEGYLRSLGNALGRFVYLCDAAMDLLSDEKKGCYNPFLAMDGRPDENRIEEYLVLTMAACTRAYEMLPLVEDKDILDNILYSGVWLGYRTAKRPGEVSK